MSVVVWDGKTLACDSLATDPGGRVGHRQKSWELPDGSLFAGVGDYRILNRMLASYQAGAKTIDLAGFIQEDTESTICVIVTRTDFFLFYPSGDLLSLGDPKFVQDAYGAGAEFALGALEMGADARQAVEVAIKHSAFCGGEIVTRTPGED